jgi:hypothetical protein
MDDFSNAMGKVIALGRPLNPNYPTNRAILILCLAALVLGAGIGTIVGLSLMEAFGRGIGLAGALFFGWALCREIVPDDEYVAFLAAVLAGIGAYGWGAPSWLPLLWALLALRLVNRTTGLPSRPLDTLGIVGIGGWLSWQGYVEVGLATAIAFWLDASLAQPLRRHRYVGLFMLVLSMAMLLAGRMPPASQPSSGLMVVGAVLFIAALLTAKTDIQSLGDVSGERLDARRVRLAGVLLAATATASLFWHGWDSFVAQMPLWAAFATAALRRVFGRMGLN